MIWIMKTKPIKSLSQTLGTSPMEDQLILNAILMGREGKNKIYEDSDHHRCQW